MTPTMKYPKFFKVWANDNFNLPIVAWSHSKVQHWAMVHIIVLYSTMKIKNPQFMYNTAILCTELFGKVTRLLRKKAKMTIWWLNIDVNSIRTHYLCTRSLCWVTKNFTVLLHISKKFSDSLKFRKIIFFSLCMINFSQIIGLFH